MRSSSVRTMAGRSRKRGKLRALRRPGRRPAPAWLACRAAGAFRLAGFALVFLSRFMPRECHRNRMFSSIAAIAGPGAVSTITAAADREAQTQASEVSGQLPQARNELALLLIQANLDIGARQLRRQRLSRVEEGPHGARRVREIDRGEQGMASVARPRRSWSRR
jgi:hypothetical protein